MDLYRMGCTFNFKYAGVADVVPFAEWHQNFGQWPQYLQLSFYTAVYEGHFPFEW